MRIRIASAALLSMGSMMIGATLLVDGALGIKARRLSSFVKMVQP